MPRTGTTNTTGQRRRPPAWAGGPGRANSRLEPGDTVLIAKGHYDEAIRPKLSGTAPKNITYAARCGAPVVFTRPADLADKSHGALHGLGFHSADGTSWVPTNSETQHI